MDIDRLISEVFLRPPIWDKRQKSYTNRGVVDSCWREISKVIGIHDAVLRKKWKYFRDQFSVEYGKVKAACLGDSGCEPYEPTWAHYKSLLFLKDVVKPRASTGAIKSLKRGSPDGGVSEILHENDDEIHEYEIRDVCHDAGEIRSEDKSTAEDNRRKRKRNALYINYNDPIIERDKQNLNFENFQPDEDWLFFRSLLSHVSKIPDTKKLCFRNRILQIVDEFAYHPPSTFQHRSISVSPSPSSVERSKIASRQVVKAEPDDTYNMYYENCSQITPG